MKRFLMAVVLAGGCSSSPEAPSRAPEFDVRGLDGASVKGSSLWSGRPVLLVFMTSW